MAGGVISHCVQLPGVIEHRLGDFLESDVSRADDEKVGHNRVDGSSLEEVPHNCRGVVNF